MNKKLKIVHISRYYKMGGAAKAALRLHTSMLEKNIPSYFISLGEDMPNEIPLVNLRSEYLSIRNILYRIYNKIRRVFAPILKTKKYKIQKELQHCLPKINAEFISLPFSEYRLENHPIIKDADIIHLHWVSDEMLDYETFFTTCTKPIVWTLHDMNPIQGLFHYKEDEINNLNIVSNLNREVVEIKNQAINKSFKNKIHIVAPSKWLADLSSESLILGKLPTSHIPYGLNQQTFKIYSNSEARRELNLPNNALIFMFIAESLNNKRKGFDLLIQALALINIPNLVLLAVGENNSTISSKNDIIYTGRITDEQLLAKYYAASNAFILPSKEDNLPNVMLEALSCGTPVIAFPTGGIKEHILPNYTGVLAEDINSAALAKAIQYFSLNILSFNSEKIREYALQKFNPDIQLAKYLDIYNRIIQ